MQEIQRTIGAIRRVHVKAVEKADVPLTLVPSYPDLPMERVYTNQPTSDIPMAVCRDVGNGRVVYLPMDLDRTFDEVGDADHLRLLRNMVLWTADERQPIEVLGPGLVDIALWRQQASLTVHLLNLNNPMAARGKFRELIAAGPSRVNVALPIGASVRSVRLLEAGREVEGTVSDGRLVVDIPRVELHEVVAVDLG